MKSFLDLFPRESLEDCFKRAARLYEKDNRFSGQLTDNKDLRRICFLVEYIKERRNEI